MLYSLVLLSALAVNPSSEFAGQFPGSSTLAGPLGQRLVHASGFLFESGALRPEDAAAAFLRLHGAAFGATGRQELVIRGAPALGEVGAVRFERTIAGLPVFGGDLVVGVDTLGRVFVVNGADVPPTTAGRHTLGEAAARSAAVSSFPDGVRRTGPVSIAKGWRAFGPAVRAVYRVDFIAEQPAGDWRVFVDGETGKVLFRGDLRYHASAPGSVFEVSPVETAASICPLSGSIPTFCASPVTVTLPNLTTGADLTGTQTTVYDCYGADAPTSAAGVPGPCASVAAASGAFNFPVDSTYRSTLDDFAAAMAYYHLDRHVSFFKGIDPTLPTGGSSRALVGSLPALVNAYQGGAPLNNAYFSPLLDAMVFGQGTNADFAYDATVIYHEFTHGVVFAWGGFNPNIDSLGGLTEPRAVNEGTADSMAVSENGRSEVGSFIGATSTPPQPFLRDMNDPDASRTCQGDGTLVPQLNGAVTSLNGLDGEVHDDGEIWDGFYWEVYQGLKAAGVRACSGACDAGPAVQYKALQLAGGTSPTFNSYWQTLKAAATALFPAQSGAAAYIDCVAKRRELDKCDRTVPVYGGESKVQYIDQRYSSFQVVLSATAAFAFGVCSAKGTTTTVYVRNGLPVQIDTATGAVTADGSATFTQLCSGGLAAFGIASAGTWYLLLDSPNALIGGTPGYDVYRIDVSPTGVASRPASTAPPTCAPPFLTVTPNAVSTPPKGSLTFTASGGSGAGYAWSLATNTSGGSITAVGVYTAGPTGSGLSSQVIDRVLVTDSLGNTSFSLVTVTQGVSIGPAAASTTPGGNLHFSAYGGSGTGFVFSLATNASGGSINAATGDYTAGPTTGVTDVVKVTDSLGNVATANVTVTALSPSSGEKSGCGCGTSGGATPLLALGLVALLRRRRKSAEQAP